MPLAEELYYRLHEEPFKPFRLHLADGRTFDVLYPRINMVGVNWIYVGVLAPGETDPDPIPDHSVKLHLDQITRVEPLPSSSPAAG
jgi:hypothetical protein